MQIHYMQQAARRRLLSALLLAACTALPGCSKPQAELEEDLLVAARNGDLEGVKKSLARRANVNARRHPQGWTALHYAASGAHLQIVEVLLKAGADPNASGAADAKTNPGPLLVAKPRVVAQAGVAMLGYLKGGRVRFEAKPEGGLQATDEDAGRRYEAIISLLAAAEAGASAAK